MKIIVDAFGGDHAPLEILKGCADAVKELDISILLTGRASEIRRVAKEHAISLEGMEIADVPDVITMEDHATDIMKAKKNSSMAEGLRRLAAGEGDAFVSAGNSGALVTGATMIVKRIKGIRRVAFAPVLPKGKGCFLLIDSGANSDCQPEMLRQFGVMGSAYMERVMQIPNPRVGLVNVGTESGKGNALMRETFPLLRDSGLNFVGNIEAREIPADAADVVVADGFTGNIILKMYEGVALTLLGKIKEIFQKSLKNKIAAAVVLKDVKTFKRQMDYNEYGGAPIMGAKKPVFKAHGSAKARTFTSALRLTKAYVESDVVSAIAETVAAAKSGSSAQELEKAESES